VKPIKWKTAKRKVSELVPHPENPRILTKKQEKDLRASLTKFDLAEIPAVNTDNQVIAGHQRLKILQMLDRGDDEIDVRIPTRKLTPAEVREYNIRSNRNIGGWDWDMLGEDFEMDDLLKWGFEDGDFPGSGLPTRNEPGEVEFSKELLIQHNYVVLYFDNAMDWQVAIEKLRLKKVRDLIPRKSQTVGIGRVIPGAPVIERLK